MKTIKLFGLLLMATLVFAACSKDDDEAMNVSGTKWEVTYAKVVVMGKSTEYKTQDELEKAYMDDELEFKADKKAYKNGVLLGVWSQSGDQVTITSEDDEEGVLTVSGSTLIMKEGVDNLFSTELHYAQVK